MAGARRCEQCEGLFTPRREHSRFCSGRCRTARVGSASGDQAARARALEWSLAAMSDTVARLARSVPGGSLAAVIEAVWQVTIVDAMLVRYHPDRYDAVMAGLPVRERAAIEGTLGGLRYVRNEISRGSSAAAVPASLPPGAAGPPAAGSWQHLPEPALAGRTAASREWEMARYRAYRDFLAGRSLADPLRRATAFLSRAAGALDQRARAQG